MSRNDTTKPPTATDFHTYYTSSECTVCQLTVSFIQQQSYITITHRTIITMIYSDRHSAQSAFSVILGYHASKMMTCSHRNYYSSTDPGSQTDISINNPKNCHPNNSQMQQCNIKMNNNNNASRLPFETWSQAC